MNRRAIACRPCRFMRRPARPPRLIRGVRQPRWSMGMWPFSFSNLIARLARRGVFALVIGFITVCWAEEVPSLDLPPGCPSEYALRPDSPIECLDHVPEGWFEIADGQVVGLFFAGHV